MSTVRGLLKVFIIFSNTNRPIRDRAIRLARSIAMLARGRMEFRGRET